MPAETEFIQHGTVVDHQVALTNQPPMLSTPNPDLQANETFQANQTSMLNDQTKTQREYELNQNSGAVIEHVQLEKQ